ncbi:hypothetical protein MSAN_01868700 [Mycena sanguinolenta]|uniref:Uncharacterized protein n=1 Tax=Mycena sanguinolenta TaxID=230812 RepID=A0A8H7CT18_9AGAR|nr:hypothetical protein MSAN_01868700 [Mycena sanguinolenta]
MNCQIRCDSVWKGITQISTTTSIVCVPARIVRTTCKTAVLAVRTNSRCRAVERHGTKTRRETSYKFRVSLRATNTKSAYSRADFQNPLRRAYFRYGPRRTRRPRTCRVSYSLAQAANHAVASRAMIDAGWQMEKKFASVARAQVVEPSRGTAEVANARFGRVPVVCTLFTNDGNGATTAGCSTSKRRRRTSGMAIHDTQDSQGRERGEHSRGCTQEARKVVYVKRKTRRFFHSPPGTVNTHMQGVAESLELGTSSAGLSWRYLSPHRLRYETHRPRMTSIQMGSGPYRSLQRPIYIDLARSPDIRFLF